MEGGAGQSGALQRGTSQLSDVVSRTQPRFFALDILRGVAAIMVVIFHYKHFFIDSTGVFIETPLPFEALLAPVYDYGLYFVELFFSISGYVFFWLYGAAVSDGRVKVRDFAIARVARLYPLFFVTFVLVALMQWAFVALYDHPFIYQDNGFFSFFLNLFMVQQWWPGAQMSFNGPSWSISVEVFLYAVFFAVCAFRLNRPWVLAGLVIVGLLWRYLPPLPVIDFTRGLPSFFLGGLVFHAVNHLRARSETAWVGHLTQALSWGVPVLWLIAWVWGHEGLMTPLIQGLESVGIGGHSLLFSTDSLVLVLSPLTLLALGLHQGERTPVWLTHERLGHASWIGDISYSLYLLHFPLQLMVMLVLGRVPEPLRTQIFASPVTLVLFMTVAIWLARLSFRYFEMPARRWLKDWLTRRLAPQS